MIHCVTVLPQGWTVKAKDGDSLLSALRGANLISDVPCGGEGRCGKCQVVVDDTEVLACRTVVDRDMTVAIPSPGTRKILTEMREPVIIPQPQEDGFILAFDIGTTTVVGCLLEGSSGRELAVAGVPNPQSAYGADVISRIRHGAQGKMEALTGTIRNCLTELTIKLCRKANAAPDEIRVVSVVGNPAMQQFLLGISVENLTRVPFLPVITGMQMIPAGDILPLWKNGQCLTVGDIAGFLGADTVACILASDMDRCRELTLMVDIGTNGEMVLGNRDGMVACSAAAGPALEGAGIRFGMGGQTGAIDHVWLEENRIRCSVIGGGSARGICGSGLMDSVAVALEQGLLNKRGKILTEDGLLPLTDGVYLTQEDIRQLQLAKGAIAAGIQLLANHMGVALSDIHKVCLAGAFGTYMDPKSACRIGLIPGELQNRITVMGNAALSGASLLACSRDARERAQRILSCTEALELSVLPAFPGCFARHMRF